MTKNNGELTALRKIAVVLVIISAIVGPYIAHDRAIITLRNDIKLVRKDISNLSLRLDSIDSKLTLNGEDSLLCKNK